MKLGEGGMVVKWWERWLHSDDERPVIVAIGGERDCFGCGWGDLLWIIWPWFACVAVAVAVVVVEVDVVVDVDFVLCAFCKSTHFEISDVAALLSLRVSVCKLLALERETRPTQSL